MNTSILRPGALASTYFPPSRPAAVRRLDHFDPPVRVLIDAYARRGSGCHRTPWRGREALRSRLDRLHIDGATADLAVAELRRRVGLISPAFAEGSAA